MRMIRQSGTPPPASAASIQWPDMNLPESSSPVKGMTPEQHAAMHEWYLGVKNVVNDHNSKIQSGMTDLHNRISDLEKTKSVAT